MQMRRCKVNIDKQYIRGKYLSRDIGELPIEKEVEKLKLA